MAETSESQQQEKDDTKSGASDRGYFGFQDLASDYYQTLIQQRRPKYCRIVWGILILVLSVLTGMLIFQLLHDYFSYDSFNTSKVSWENNITFPAISICSSNLVNYTALKESMEAEGNENLINEFDEFMVKMHRFDTSMDVQNYFNLTAFSDLNQWEKANGFIDKNFGNNFFDMIIGSSHYKFAGSSRSIRDSNRVTFGTGLGMCFELNDNGKLQQVVPGIDGGFSIDLDAQVGSYMPTTSTIGFVLFIRDQDETVMLNQGGYVIAPGTETFVKLNAQSVKRLPKPHGTCKNIPSESTKYSKVHYQTVRECVQGQKLGLAFKVCKCMPWHWAERMYSLNKTSVLDDTVAYIKEQRNSKLKEVRSKHNTDKRGSKENHKRRDEDEDSEKESIYNSSYIDYVCHYTGQQVCNFMISEVYKHGKNGKRDDILLSCSEPCSFRNWGVEISSTHFPPTEAYFNDFIKSYTWRNPNYTYAKENLTRLHIYYDDIKVTNVEQVKSYEVQNLLAEFGGTVDLFIGFSFFSIFQLIEILVGTILYKYKNMNDLPSFEDGGVIYQNPQGNLPKGQTQ